ncbi:YlxR family protein [Actinopolymorpha rutila]|uniref:YlxR family protein n=1 Tax=Actinopolymorpha rutila TaxID=446787 RepID=UPI0031DEEF59
MGRTGREPNTRPHAVRTCVGCRQRTAKSDLLRVVLARDETATRLVADVTGHAPGRGAHLHPTRECLGLAERRRAFARALRARAPIDVGPLRRHVEQQDPVDTGQADATDLASNAPNTGDAQRDQGRRPGKESGSSGS